MLTTLSIWIIILPLLVGTVRWRWLNNDSRWMFTIVVLGTIPQVITAFIGKTPLRNCLYNIYTPLEFLCLFFLFVNKFEDRWRRRLVVYTVYLYIILSLLLLARFGWVQKFINEWVCANNLIYVFWLLLFFRDQYSAQHFALQPKNPFTWYVFGLIIYAPCTLLVFALYYYISANPHSVLKNLWVIHDICNILMYLFFTTGLALSSPKKNYVYPVTGNRIAL